MPPLIIVAIAIGIFFISGSIAITIPSLAKVPESMITGPIGIGIALGVIVLAFFLGSYFTKKK